MYKKCLRKCFSKYETDRLIEILNYAMTDSMNMNLRKLWEIVKDRVEWHAAVHGCAKNQTGLSD